MKHVSQVMNRTIPSMTFLREETCECGEDVKVYEMEIGIGPRKGEMIESKIGCKCEDIKLANEAVNRRNRLKVDKMKTVFDKHSLINRELQQATFENYESSNPSQDKALKISRRFVEVFDKDKPINLLFAGAYGVGKSHLAKSITDGIISKGFSSIFISVPKLLTKFRSSYNKDSDYSESDLIDALSTVDVLILDDLGAEKDSDWSWEKLFEIVDSRQGLHTIYTSNYSPEDLIVKMGERNFSRIVNRDTTTVEIKGDNYRLGNFKKGAN
ncbi:ATP-binding protein [Oceanobacillus oncorhynchi]|uniref:ATP-binding protein n=1 Tax=Oceanobacillus oncorhynchi TaxID=545501 RepID=UPI001868EC07|nr:ATP-binding protein [Oceanobacillus oncorhynchi]